jgi:outer membrane protein TolC
MEGMAPVRQAESRVRELERRMELRRQVLEGAMSGEEAEREVELSQVRGELDVLERASERAAMQLGTAEERVGQGLAGESELLGARLQLLQFETRMEVLRMKLDILEGRDTGSGGDQ